MRLDGARRELAGAEAEANRLRNDLRAGIASVAGAQAQAQNNALGAGLAQGGDEGAYPSLLDQKSKASGQEDVLSEGQECITYELLTILHTRCCLACSWHSQ